MKKAASTTPRAKDKPPSHGGQNRFSPAKEQRTLVEALAGYGIPHDEIVKLLPHQDSGEPISPTTLRVHFRSELERGKTVANSRVAGALFKNATTGTKAFPGGIPIAQIFWLKTQARWKSEHPVEPPPPPDPGEKKSRLEIARRIALVFYRGRKTLQPTALEPVTITQGAIKKPVKTHA